jgi:hypothetical protein
MRQPINLNQAELDELAQKAEELSDWLEDQAFQVVTRLPVPSGLVSVGSIIAVTGIAVILDGAVPDSVCWAGCLYPK